MKTVCTHIVMPLLVLAAVLSGIWWITEPPAPATAAPLEVVAASSVVDPRGIDLVGFAWYLSKVALAATPFLAVVMAILCLPRYLKARHEVEMVRAQRPIPEMVTNYTAPRVTYNPHYGARAVPADPYPALLEAGPAVDLPERVLLSDAMRAAARDELVLGASFGNDLITATPGSIYHVLFQGQTRSGKTTAIHSLIAQLHHKHAQGMPIQLYAGDGKGELYSTWRGSPLFPEGIPMETRDIIDMLDTIVHDPTIGLEARKRLFARTSEAYPDCIIQNIADYEETIGETLPRAFIFVDEINSLLTEGAKDDRLVAALLQLLQKGAGLGFNVLGGAIHLTADVLKMESKINFVTKAHFREPNPDAIRMLFGNINMKDVLPYLPNKQGRGLIKTVGIPQPTPFQSVLCEKHDILDAIAAVRRPQFAPSQPAPLSTIEHQQHQETDDTEIRQNGDFDSTGAAGALGSDAEIKAIIRRMHERGKSQNEVIETVYGLKRGSGPKYQAARKEYLEIISELEDA